jgi:hypothetical protein
MNVTAVKQSADFGQRTFAVLSGLQLEALDRVQKLTQLNLATLKDTFDSEQSAKSSSQFGPPAIAAMTDLSQQFSKRAISYAQQVEEIEGKFQNALIQACEGLQGQYRAAWTQLAANVGQTAFSGSDAAAGAVQFAIAAMRSCEESMQDAVRQAGAASTVGGSPAHETA